jgi:hypothetical protein
MKSQQSATLPGFTSDDQTISWEPPGSPLVGSDAPRRGQPSPAQLALPALTPISGDSPQNHHPQGGWGRHAKPKRRGKT